MSEKPDNLKLAVASVVTCVCVLSFGDAVIKRLASDFSLWQLYLLRSLLTIPVLLAWVATARDIHTLRPVALDWTVLRSTILATHWIGYYVALPHVDLAVAAAIYYTFPIFITLFSAAIGRDSVGSRHWLAIAIGFTGILLVVRPSGDGFNAYALLPLAASVLFAIGMVMTRTRCHAEDPRILSLWLNFAFAAIGATATGLLALIPVPQNLVVANAFVFGEWVSMGPDHWFSTAILATTILLGSVLAAVAYQRGPGPVVASFDYTYLAFSAMWGIVFFAEVPTVSTLVGMLLIATGGILSLRATGPRARS